MKTSFRILLVLLAGGFAMTFADTADAQPPRFEDLQTACIAGDQGACTDAGVAMTAGRGIRKDEVRAAQLFLAACVQNDPRACLLWGYALENGRGIAVNLPEARKAYEGGCTGGYGLACNNAGVLYHGVKGGPRDEAMAKSFYSKACEMNLGLGCRNLGVLYADAETLPQSQTYAVMSFDKACRLGDADACTKQAWHAEQGLGTARDIEQARRLYANACSARYSLACQNAKLLASKYPTSKSAEIAPN
jgi:TPR repeat protein